MLDADVDAVLLLCASVSVNDAPSLKQAEVGCAVSNATDVAKGSASALLLSEGISGVVSMVEVGRQVHARVQVWVSTPACTHTLVRLHRWPCRADRFCSVALLSSCRW